MTQTITAVFETRDAATEAVGELTRMGVARDRIKLMPEGDTSYTRGDATSYDHKKDEGGFWAGLKDMFGASDDHDRYTYAESMSRGDIVLTVQAEESQTDDIVDILDNDGVVDIAERQESWRKEGWTGYAGSGEASASDDTRAIPVMEEELKIGKRAVEGGRVRVHSRVVETPVSEDVSLRQEKVHVERRAVDRAVGTGDLDPFQERTIEMMERGEEAVVQKTARVKEEITIGKDVEQETRTVSDTVRHTEVEVEDDRSGKTGARSTTGKPRV